MKLKSICLLFLTILFLTSCSDNSNNDDYKSTTIDKVDKNSYSSAYEYVSNKCDLSNYTVVYSIGSYSVMYRNQGSRMIFDCLFVDQYDSIDVQLRLPKEKPNSFFVSYARHSIASSCSYPYGKSNLINFDEYKGYANEKSQDYQALKTGIGLIIGGFSDHILVGSNFNASDLGF